MATTSGLSVSPGLGVSVIEWSDHVSGEMLGMECTLALGGGSWLKNMLGASCGFALKSAFSRFGFPSSDPDPVVE